MLLTVTEEPRTSSVVRGRVELGTAVELDVRAAQVELEALAVPEDLVVPAERAALAELANRVA
jgi:hypothetical protein